MTITQVSKQSAICFVALALVVILAALFYPQHSLTHDASWYLIATQKFVDGAALYTDIIEINPPLAFYLTAPAIGLARLLSIGATTAYFLYCIGLGAIASLWIMRLLRSAALTAGQKYALFGSALITLYLLPIAEFGQREHLMLLFALPFMFYLVLGDQIKGLSLFHRAALGIIAALGLMLKPYFLLIPAGIVIMRLLRERDWRLAFDPALLAIGFALAAYLAFIALHHPAYLGEIVPMAKLVYSAYGTSAAKVWMRPELYAAVLLGFLVWQNRRTLDPVFLALCGACAGAAISYLLQYKGWDYHALPLAAFLIIAAAWLAVSYLQESASKLAFGILLLMIAMLTLGTQIARGPYKSHSTQDFGRFVQRQDMRILVLSTNVYAAFPFVNEVSGQWTSRFPAQWLIPGAYSRLKQNECGGSDDACADLENTLDYARNAMIEDFQKFEPEIVFIDQRMAKSYFGDLPFDYLAFLSEDRRFQAIRNCYRRTGRTEVYSVWTRVTDTNGC